MGAAYKAKVAKISKKIEKRQAERGGALKGASKQTIRAKARGIIQKRKLSK